MTEDQELRFSCLQECRGDVVAATKAYEWLMKSVEGGNAAWLGLVHGVSAGFIEAPVTFKTATGRQWDWHGNCWRTVAEVGNG